MNSGLVDAMLVCPAGYVPFLKRRLPRLIASLVALYPMDEHAAACLVCDYIEARQGGFLTVAERIAYQMPGAALIARAASSEGRRLALFNAACLRRAA